MAALACLTAACTYKDDAQEKEYAQYVRLSESVKFMVTGEEADLHAVFTPRGTAYEVEWESDAPAVAQVEEGRVRALSGGRAQIAVKIVNTTHKAVCEVIVSEKQVSEKFAGREDAAHFSSPDGALAACEDGDTVLFFRGYYACGEKVDKNVKLLGEQGVFIGGLTVADGACVSLENIGFYTSSAADTASLTVEEDCGAVLENCRFIYDVKELLPGSDAFEEKEQGKQEKEEELPRGAKGRTALTLEPGFAELKMSGCAFSGYECALDVLPSDAEIFVRDNTFTDCAVAIRVDVRAENTQNTALHGIIQSNVFSGVEHPTVFNYNGGLYMGKLKFDDYIKK